MNKVNNESLDINNNSIEQLKQLFPEIVSEGNKIDFNKLKCVLSDQLDDKQERYQFTWNGKRDAIKISNTPTTATLKPIKDKSKNWSETKNVYIEGDNLEVLKILQRSYANKVKVIYIDPPYNTGKDFVFKDSFQSGIENYLEQTGQVDGDGNKLSTNSETNGRFHSDWLSMMYPRLKLGRNLLTDDGIIFISIDDNEQANLKKLCDEIFGEENYIDQIVRNTNSSKNQSKFISNSHDYCLVYSKNRGVLEEKHSNNKWEVPKNNIDVYQKKINELKKLGLSNEKITEELKILTKYPRFIDMTNYWYLDEKGVYRKDNLGGVKNGNYTPLINPLTGKEDPIPPGGFRYPNMEELKKENRIHFHTDGSLPTLKRYLFENENSRPKAIMSDDQRPDSSLLDEFGTPFDNPKQLAFIERIFSIADDDAIFLDFFSGSGTSAHAAMKLNYELGGNRKYIMVQLPEILPEDSDGYKKGFRSITELGIERINQAGQKIIHGNDNNKNIDTGYRYFKLDNSNIIKWDSQIESADDATALFADNFKVDSTKDDIVFELLLKQGMSLTDNITEKSFDETTVYIINQGEMFIVLGNQITEQVAEYIREYQFSLEKSEVVIAYQDSGFDNDSSKLNSFEILKTSGFDEENIYTV